MDLKGVADALCDAYARSDNFVKDRALVAMGEIETYFLDKPEYISECRSNLAQRRRLVAISLGCHSRCDGTRYAGRGGSRY